MNQPQNNNFKEAGEKAAQLPYILTREAKHSKQQQILRLLLAGLKGVK